MTSEELIQLKSRIEKRIEKESEKVLSLREVTKPIELSSAVGRLSRMDALNNRSVNLASLRETEAKLERLKYSLSHFGSDNFGKCVSCRAEIQYQRLFALPETVKCIRCASR